MSDCKRASLSQIINLFIPAKYVELGDKAFRNDSVTLAIGASWNMTSKSSISFKISCILEISPRKICNLGFKRLCFKLYNLPLEKLSMTKVSSPLFSNSSTI